MTFPEKIYEVTEAGNVWQLDYAGPFADNPRFAMYRSTWSFSKAVPARAIAGLNGRNKGDYYTDQEQAVQSAISDLKRRLASLEAKLEQITQK